MESDKITLKTKLQSISRKKQLGFALLLCQRMMPALDQFANETHFKNSLYNKCLAIAWHEVTESTDNYEYEKLAKECFDNAPDTEDFESTLTSASLNTTLAISALMSFLATSDVDLLVEAAMLARDTVALYAQTIEVSAPESLTSQQVVEHPLVQNEMRQQMGDLEFLEALETNSSTEMWRCLRRRARETSALLPV